MKTNKRMIKAGLVLALLVPAAGAYAAAESDTALEEVVVTGIRASVQQSLEAKRNAAAVVEVVTAEDIGKMPDKNIADSLQRVSGVTTSSAGANEGGFDENDRVSMRGTNPSLTQTLINGHNVASGDWFVLNQVGLVGRSVSYTMLPSELVSKVVVHKSSEASLVEGGVAGSIDIITRKPLEFTKPVTLQASAGVVDAKLPGKTDPQFSALGNWKNDAGDFGVMLQFFSEERHLRRDGQELLGYTQLSATSAAATSNPDLANAWYPSLIGSALFEQRRQRQGGLVDAEFKPSDKLSLDLSYFTSKLTASNYNRNYMLWLGHFLPGQAPDAGYTLTNGTLTSASFTGVPGTTYGVYDQISRPDESASTNYYNLDANYEFSSALKFTGQVGQSTGHGRTPHQDVLETVTDSGTGGSYAFNGIATATSWNLGTMDNSTPNPGGVPVGFGWIFGDQNIDVVDEAKWIKVDGEYTVNSGALTTVQFGLRSESHDRSSAGVIGQGPACNGGPLQWAFTFACPDAAGAALNPANYPVGFQNYPTNFGSGLGGTFPTNVWYFTPAQLAAYNNQFAYRDPVSREDWNSEYSLHESNAAAFGQLNFKGSAWSGNVGLRVVQTKERAVNNVSANASTPGAITTSAFGTFIPQATEHTYTDVLPSANLKWDVAQDLVARFAASETMTRADYSALAGPVSLTPPATLGGTGSGSGSNPDLKPIRSINFDAGLEWYFAPHSLLSAGLFYMDLQNYIAYGSVTKDYLTFDVNNPQGFTAPYLLTVPINSKGRVQGLEFSYQQEITAHTGVTANYTYADGKQTSDVAINGDDRLVGTSKNTYNISGYYEDSKVSLRVNYSYRSAFYSGLDRNSAFSQAAIAGLAASLGYTINDNFSVTLDGENLNNPTLKYYGLNESQPRAFYKNGQQYYLTLRMKL